MIKFYKSKKTKKFRKSIQIPILKFHFDVGDVLKTPISLYIYSNQLLKSYH